MKTAITELFGIKYPIVQGGMVWCSGWELASAVSNAGGLGIIGAGSMSAEVLDQHIEKCKAHTDKPFGVNIPLLYTKLEEQLAIIVKHKVPIVVTSAGNPASYTATLKAAGICVVHVIANLKFALKADAAGVDALIAEGFEAGGHNGREELTTMCLLELLRGKTKLPIIAAGGIASGEAMHAAFVLGAQGVQVGSRFAIAKESSASEAFKQAVIQSKEGDTTLTLKELAPVRLLKNEFYKQIENAYLNQARKEDLISLLGKGRSKRGIFEGDLVNGELEIGQIAAKLSQIERANEIVADLMLNFTNSLLKSQALLSKLI